jgi:hypothetical protein
VRQDNGGIVGFGLELSSFWSGLHRMGQDFGFCWLCSRGVSRPCVLGQKRNRLRFSFSDLFHSWLGLFHPMVMCGDICVHLLDGSSQTRAIEEENNSAERWGWWKRG